MAFDPANSPLLTPIDIASTPSYGLPMTSNVIGSTAYNTNVVWNGPGGTFQIITSGNLAQIAQISTTGFLAVKTPGTSVVTALITAGNGIGVTEVGDDYKVSVLPNTTAQLVVGQYNSTTVGNARGTVNIKAGVNTSVTLVDSGTSLDWTINASSSATPTGPFVLTQAEASLTGATNLGALSTGLVLSTVSDGVATLSTVEAGSYPALSDTQTWTGVNTFSQPIITSGEDILPGTIPTTAVSGTAMTLNSVQTVTAVKTFTSTTIFSDSIQIPTGGAVGKVLGSDATGIASWQVAGAGDATLAGANVFTGTSTYDVALPTSTVTPSADEDFVTKVYVDETFSPVDLTGTVTTTDATLTTIASIAVAELSSATVTGTLTAAKSDFTDACGGTFTITARRAAAGNVTLVSPAYVVISTSTTATFNASVDTGTQAILITVTGIAATTYNWSAQYSVNTLV